MKRSGPEYLVITFGPPMRATFRKHERLVGRDRLKLVATTGKTVRIHPFRLTGLLMPLDTVAPAQVAFAIPKRYVKLATDRNRMRRLMREAYRLNKHRWYERLDHAKVQCAWLMIYQGNSTLSWEEVSEKITGAFDRWTHEHVHLDR